MALALPVSSALKMDGSKTGRTWLLGALMRLAWQAVKGKNVNCRENVVYQERKLHGLLPCKAGKKLWIASV